MKHTVSAFLSLALLSLPAARADDHSSEFLTPVINLGCVVKDIEASVKFYTEAIGFTEVPGFHIPADFASASGLTDGKKFDVRVLVLEEGNKGATHLKLIGSPDGKSASSDNAFIDSQLGFSYLTIVVKSTDAALARLAKAGVKPIAQGPAKLPDNLDPALSLTIVRDPDGNLVELVGPNPTAE